MELFGIGAGELFLIMILALVVIGPERLPEVAGQIGRTVGDLRRQANQLTGEFQRSLEVAVQERQEQRTAEPPTADGLVCIGCGARGSDGAQFCATCGERLSERPIGGERQG
jgi:Tat protein translocase TatB subunit